MCSVMQAPFVKWVEKPSHLKGHANSLNVLISALDGFDWLVLLEDDWFFVMDDEYVGRAIDILASDDSIGQVVGCTAMHNVI